MAIKVGDVVTVKTSEEPAFVLRLYQAPTVDGQGLSEAEVAAASVMSGFLVDVRVPVLRDGGVHHEIRTFLVEELETQEESLARKKSQYMRFLGDPAENARLGGLHYIPNEPESLKN